VARRSLAEVAGARSLLADASPPSPALLARPPLEVAPWLLGTILVRRDHRGEVVAAGRIVEAEAYGGADDPASHAARGPTARNGTMFGPPGRLYVYFTYGMHWCCNVVAHRHGEAGAVLLRALEPLLGEDRMAARRPRARRPQDLTAGPARLTQALDLDGRLDGVDLLDPGAPVGLLDDGWRPASWLACRRIGIRQAADRPWRFVVPGSAYLSRPPDPA
jgi:DNA-3-methyladenine glycosylase